MSARSGGQPGQSTVPPASAPGRGKFTVGNLLSTAQGAGSTSSKKGESANAAHRQQIGALPRQSIRRDRASSPPPAESRAYEHSRAPTLPTAAVVSGVQVRSQVTQRNTTPPQPFAAQPVTGSTPSAAEASPLATDRTTPSQPFAAFTLEPATERTTPSQPFAAFTLEPATERSARSQPFTALASPMVSVGSDTLESQEAPSAIARESPHVEDLRPVLSARDLLAPELHEVTPKGIGVVTISSPAAAIRPITAQPGAVPAAPIIPIATVSVGQSSEPERVTIERAAASRGQPGRITVKSQPPPAAPVLDDPDGWELAPSTTVSPTAANPSPPVAPKVDGAAERDPKAALAAAKAHGADSAARKSAAKAALEKARASNGKLKASKAVESDASGTKPPSSHSKLLRAGSAEGELSGEFFAVAPGDLPDVAVGSYHEELLDERVLRSLSPEVVARRGRYRVVVVLVILGPVLLLGAAIALKLLHRP